MLIHLHHLSKLRRDSLLFRLDVCIEFDVHHLIAFLLFDDSDWKMIVEEEIRGTAPTARMSLVDQFILLSFGRC